MLSDLPATILTGGLYSALKGGGKQAVKSAAKASVRPFEKTMRRSMRRTGTLDPSLPTAAARQVPVPEQQANVLQQNLQRLIREQGDTPETAAAARALNESHAASLKPRPIQAQPQAPPSVPPTAPVPRQQMLQEGTELLAKNQPRQWNPMELIGPESTSTGQEAVREALAQMAYSVGDAGARKGKAVRSTEFHRIRKILDGNASLQEKQEAALKLVSEWGEEARLRRMATESPGDYPLRNLRDRFGYKAVPVAAAGAQTLRSLLRREPEAA